MKQRCYLAAIYLNWAFLLGGVAFLAFTRHYALALAWAAFLPPGLRLYVRVFPFISKSMGYGKVDDEPAHECGHAPVEVIFYTAAGCPFCPIVRQRLLALRDRMGFTIHEIDVTLRPRLLMAKGIQAVPVVEIADSRLDGNATSEQLAKLISCAVNAVAA